MDEKDNRGKKRQQTGKALTIPHMTCRLVYTNRNESYISTIVKNLSCNQKLTTGICTSKYFFGGVYWWQ